MIWKNIFQRLLRKKISQKDIPVLGYDGIDPKNLLKVKSSKPYVQVKLDGREVATIEHLIWVPKHIADETEKIREEIRKKEFSVFWSTPEQLKQSNDLDYSKPIMSFSSCIMDLSGKTPLVQYFYTDEVQKEMSLYEINGEVVSGPKSNNAKRFKRIVKVGDVEMDVEDYKDNKIPLELFEDKVQTNALSGLIKLNTQMENKVEYIAKACHEANRVWCQANGDMSQKHWSSAEQWQRDSAIAGVKFRLENPDAKNDAQHNAWMQDKINDGWVYGEVKDAEKKTHPCIVPFSELPEFQQKKDALFCAIVDALK